MLARTRAEREGLAWLVVIAVFVFDVLVSRSGWCSYICPVGAFYGLAGKFSLLRVNARNRAACTDCGDCYRVCPEPHVLVPALKPSSPVDSIVIKSGDCTNCGRASTFARKTFFISARVSPKSPDQYAAADSIVLTPNFVGPAVPNRWS